MKTTKAYKNYLLKKGKKPKIFSKFIQKNELENKENFNSFEEIEKEIWRNFAHKIQTEIDQTEDYSAREKTLAYFYILNHLFSKNTKLISLLNNNLKSKTNILSFQKEYSNWMKETIELAIENKEIAPRPFLSEKYIYLFNLLLGYILRIQQKNEPQLTEVAIEKSVNLLFDTLKTGTLDSMLDFGKFVIQNKAF